MGLQEAAPWQTVCGGRDFTCRAVAFEALPVWRLQEAGSDMSREPLRAAPPHD
jgi:hypothetical protein